MLGQQPMGVVFLTCLLPDICICPVAPAAAFLARLFCPGALWRSGLPALPALLGLPTLLLQLACPWERARPSLLASLGGMLEGFGRETGV